MGFIANIKNSFNNYLERVAKENKELFGDGRPDCCSLNRQTSSDRTGSTKTEPKNNA